MKSAAKGGRKMKLFRKIVEPLVLFVTALVFALVMTMPIFISILCGCWWWMGLYVMHILACYLFFAGDEIPKK